MSNRILRFPEVSARTGLSRSRLYHAMAEGTFPLSIAIGERAIGWVEAEVDSWVDACIDRSRREREDLQAEFDSGEDKRPALGF